MNIINEISGLIQREIPSTTIERSFSSLSDAYTQLQKLSNDQGDNSQPIRKLLGIIRLTAISQNLVLNEKLVDYGIDSIIKITTEDISNIGDIERGTLDSIRNRARNYRKIEELVLSKDIISKALNKQLIISVNSPISGLSILSPAAYLIDLIWFIQGCFFSNIDDMEKRFYRSLKDFPINKKVVEEEVYQIEIANKVIETFILEEVINKLQSENISELTNILRNWSISRETLENISQDRNQLYKFFSSADLGCPKPQVFNELVKFYLDEIGISKEELEKLFKKPVSLNLKLGQQFSQINLRESNLIEEIKNLGITEQDLKSGLTDEQRERVIGKLNTLVMESRIPSDSRQELLNKIMSSIENISSPFNKFLENLYLNNNNKKEYGNILISVLQNNLSIENIEKLSNLIRISKTKGQFPHIPQTDLEEYQTKLNQAESTIKRIKEYTLEAIRENLVYIALKISPDKENATTLGNYLYTDLSATLASKTTLVANIIEALQSFILSFRLQKEYTLKEEFISSEDDFEDCLQWLQSYSLWHASQMIYLYPENFLFPGTRRKSTKPFQDLLTKSNSFTNTKLIKELIDEYRKSWNREHFIIDNSYTSSVIANHPKIWLISWKEDNCNEVIFSEFDLQEKIAVQKRIIIGKRGDFKSSKFIEGVKFCNKIYLFFYSFEKYKFYYTSIDPTSDECLTSPIYVEGDDQYYTNQPLGFISNLEYLFVYILGKPLTISSIRIDKNNMQTKVLGSDSIQWPIDIYRQNSGFSISTIGELDDKHYLLIRGKSAISDNIYFLEIPKPPNNYNQNYQLKQIHSFTGKSTSTHEYFSGVISNSQIVVLVIRGNKLYTGCFSPQINSSNNSDYPNVQLCYGNLLTSPRKIFTISNTELLVYSDEKISVIDIKNIKNNSLNEILAINLDKFSYKSGQVILDNQKVNLRDHPIERNKENLIEYLNGQNLDFDSVSSSTLLNLDEWYLYIPLLVAYSLNSSQNYRDAANWLHLCYYPFAKEMRDRFLYKGPGKKSKQTSSKSQKDYFEWLNDDPLDPYQLLHVWEGSIEKYLIIQYVQNLLDWADSEFTRDTQESITRARELYELADGIIKKESDVLDKKPSINLQIPDSILSQQEAKTIHDIFRDFEQAESHLNEAEDHLVKLSSDLDDNYLPQWLDSQNLSVKISLTNLLALKCYGGGFYIPSNPILKTLELRIKTSLEKIRMGCNFIGMRRNLPIYSLPADPLVVLQQDRNISQEETTLNELLPYYRFSYLIERARYYVSIAQQLETLLLQSYEKFDAEHYNLLKAKQDLKVSESNLALQQLRVTEANDGCALAQYQREKSELQYAHFDKLIKIGLSEKENISMERFWQSYNWGIAAGFLEATMSGIEGGISGGTKGGFWGALVGAILGGATGQTKANSEILSKLSQARAMQASFERREQEWEFQRDLANKDTVIGRQGETLATDRKNITEQERNIARLQSSFAGEVVNFLETKFTNEDLWNWMSRVVKQLYRVHLSFAIQTARMAQRALAFERQESLTFIASYYANAEKRDLLAAEQLLSDINRLDQHRLTTERRRKELTKVISLASVAPIEFQRMRQTGWMTFATLTDWFDRDFPGHYMRLIKSVSLTVVGLIPPNESIHVTLQNNGLSEVIVGSPWTEYKTIQRQPESISVTAASNGTGLFELRLDDPILLPFEGSGVQARWTLELPKGANRFDFNTLADIYFTIRYTALEDGSYRKRVLDQLGTYSNEKQAWLVPIQNMVSFNLRTFDSDAWYHLNNPDFSPAPSNPPYSFEFKLEPTDFPPNEEITGMRRLNLAFNQARSVKVPLLIEFYPKEPKPGEPNHLSIQTDYEWDRSQNKGGPISSASFDGAQPFGKPFGRWRLTIRTDVNPANYPELFKDSTTVETQIKLNLDWLTDALFVVTYEAEVEYGYAQTLEI